MASSSTAEMKLVPLQATYGVFLLKAFGTLFAAVTVIAVLGLLRYMYQMRILAQSLPGNKKWFFNVSGDMRDFKTNASYKGGLPILVCFMQLVGAYATIFKKAGMFCSFVFYVPLVVVTKAEGIEALLGASTKHMQKSWLYNWLHPWLSTGLLTSHGGKWKSRRKLLTPSFHSDILKDFIIILNEQSQVLVKRLREDAERDFTDIAVPITYCGLDIICETVLGGNVKMPWGKKVQYIDSVNRVSEIILERVDNPWYWFDTTFVFTKLGREFKKHVANLHDFTRTLIQERKRQLTSGEGELDNRKRKALLDSLLEQHMVNANISFEDVQEEVDTFVLEGHDTTAMGMSWALYLIGLYPDVQEKLHEEVDRVFGDDRDRPATTDDLKDLEYLERVIKESQRLYPSVPLIARETSEDVDICGYTVPKGTSCFVFQYFLHRDETVFPDPEKFDADRFLPENTAKRHPYAFVPFSAGPRNCIGQRFALNVERVVLSTILRNFTLESLDQRDVVQPVPEIVLRSINPLRIRIRPRHANKA